MFRDVLAPVTPVDALTHETSVLRLQYAGHASMRTPWAAFGAVRVGHPQPKATLAHPAAVADVLPSLAIYSVLHLGA